MGTTTLPVWDDFVRGVYPDDLNGSVSPSGDTWASNDEFKVDIDIEGPTGDPYAYCRRIGGSFDGEWGYATIDHGFANGVICCKPFNIVGTPGGWHRLIFRWVDADNYSFASVDAVGGPFQGVALTNRVAGVETEIASTNAFPTDYLEVRFSGTAIQVWVGNGDVEANYAQALTGVITERTSSTVHGLGSNENGQDSFESRAMFLDFGVAYTYGAAPAAPQTSASRRVLRP